MSITRDYLFNLKTHSQYKEFFSYVFSQIELYDRYQVENFMNYRKIEKIRNSFVIVADRILKSSFEYNDDVFRLTVNIFYWLCQDLINVRPILESISKIYQRELKRKDIENILFELEERFPCSKCKKEITIIVKSRQSLNEKRNWWSCVECFNVFNKLSEEEQISTFNIIKHSTDIEKPTIQKVYEKKISMYNAIKDIWGYEGVQNGVLGKYLKSFFVDPEELIRWYEWGKKNKGFPKYLVKNHTKIRQYFDEFRGLVDIGEKSLEINHCYVITYSIYLQLPHWKEIRDKTLDFVGHQCQWCNVKTDLHVHHRDYENLWNEEPGKDTTALCAKHHKMIHQDYTAPSPPAEIFVPRKFQYQIDELKHSFENLTVSNSNFTELNQPYFIGDNGSLYIDFDESFHQNMKSVISQSKTKNRRITETLLK